MALIISLFAGAIGGIVGGVALSKYSMGTPSNMVAGIVGGGIGGQLLGSSIAGYPAGEIIAGAVGGFLVMVIAGVIKNMRSN